MNEPEMYHGSSGVLYGVARTAYQRTQAAPSDHEPDQRDALVAILFSAASLEGYISDITAVCRNMGRAIKHAGLEGVGGTLDEMESARCTVQGKFMLAKLLFSGQGYDKGQPPYQDFDLLFTLRSAIVHLKPERIPNDTERMVAKLKTKGILAPTPSRTHCSWVSSISTRAAAKWACGVPVAMEQSMRDAMACFLLHGIDGAPSARELLGPWQVFTPHEQSV